MAVFEWRKLNFFDLRLNPNNDRVLEAVKDSSLTCGVSGKGQIILCDTQGLIHIFSRNWEYTTLKGHDSAVILCALSLQNNLLVTIANEDNGKSPIFKVWNLAKLTKTNGAPCLRTVKTEIQRPTSLAVTDNGQYMAIGFDRGGILLYKGDIGRDRAKTLKTLSSGISPITGISFKQQGKATYMYVCSDSGVLIYNLQNKDRETKIVLDPKYASARCCALQAYFMVGKDDAVYCYTLDGRGPCYALEGEKSVIQWFRSHLLTIIKPTQNIFTSQKEYLLTVIDVQNKLIVFMEPIDAVAAILIEFGTCFIVTKRKEIYQLDEKDLQSKLSSLFKKNLYDVAIRIAKGHQYDSEGLVGIFKQYGDHLYGKGNYSDAVEQYKKTIGYVEPSYIIRRFLDFRHIHYLTNYLQELHKQGHATPDHTTLLLNCFTRLDLTDELKNFLSNDGNPDIMFDLDVAIKVCRNASVDQALSLARKNQKYDQCISILMEEMEAYEETLDYISTLPILEAEKNLNKYGTILMEHCPDKTTELLKKLCIDHAQEGGDTAQFTDMMLDNTNRIDWQSNFLQLFIKYPNKLIEFLEHLVGRVSNCSAIVYNTLIELYLKKWQTDKSVESRLMEILEKYEDVYDKNHIIILCRMSNFWPGIMLIYEEEKLYHLIVRHHLKTRNYDSLLSTCKRLGNNHPSLWLQALTGLRSDHSAPPNVILQILNVIANEKLQSPLQVLNCLAVENGPKLSSVRDYFLRAFEKEADLARKEAQIVEESKEKLETLRNHIENLRNHPIEFSNTLCNACNKPLTIPSVYFLCQHSFHQDCMRIYSDSDKECSVCHLRNSQLLGALRAQNESRNQHQAFRDVLDRSHDPFAEVSKYFGHDLFNKILIVDEKCNEEINQNILPASKSLAVENLSSNVGAGAEARLRLIEGNITPAMTNIIPPSEARLRLEEHSRQSKTIAKEKTTKITPRVSPNVQMKPGNPFEGNDATPPKPGNPFETPGNPFGEYDDNWNPA